MHACAQVLAYANRGVAVLHKKKPSQRTKRFRQCWTQDACRMHAGISTCSMLSRLPGWRQPARLHMTAWLAAAHAGTHPHATRTHLHAHSTPTLTDTLPHPTLTPKQRHTHLPISHAPRRAKRHTQRHTDRHKQTQTQAQRYVHAYTSSLTISTVCGTWILAGSLVHSHADVVANWAALKYQHCADSTASLASMLCCGCHHSRARVKLQQAELQQMQPKTPESNSGFDALCLPAAAPQQLGVAGDFQLGLPEAAHVEFAHKRLVGCNIISPINSSPLITQKSAQLPFPTHTRMHQHSMHPG